MSKKLRLIVFLIPGEKSVNGGILSIFSLCEESRKLRDLHNADVLLITYPGGKSYRKNDLFINNEVICSFDELVSKGVPDYLLLHIPEYASFDTFTELKKYSQYLESVKELRVNILNQNILIMQRPEEVANWFSLTPYVTQTTAHNKYSTQELSDSYNMPVHHFSTYLSKGMYDWVPYGDKKNLIVFSPDQVKKRSDIIEKLKRELPEFEFITIENMTYETYKKTMGSAKFAITFGEGMDGYYLEGFFTGGITFAVYNDEFFAEKEFSKFVNTYPNYDDMFKNIVEDIKSVNNRLSYEKVNQENLNILNKLYDFKTYQNNIKNFYLNKYTYSPSPESANHLIRRIMHYENLLLEARDKIIHDVNQALIQKEDAINAQRKAINELEARINSMRRSISWTITKPLRVVKRIKRRT